MDEQTPSAESGWELHGPHHEQQAIPLLPRNFTPLRLLLQPGGLCVQLNTPDMYFGRHTDMDVRLALPDVSRRHCRFIFHNGCWKVVDLDSLNGVYVNGARIREAVLHDGDDIRLGGLSFRVTIPDPQSTQSYASGSQQKAILKSIAEVLPPPQRDKKSKAS